MPVMESYRRDKVIPGRDYPPRIGREFRPGNHAAAARRVLRVSSRGVSAISDAQRLASRIASLPETEIRQRYHELVDKRLGGDLTVLERFELERIEIRLDAEDRDPGIEARDRQWDAERAELLESIEGLLLKLRR